MKRPKHYDSCRICGKDAVLTYEHVPPKNAFNSHTVVEYSFDQVINMMGDSKRMPWDHSGIKGKYNQKGSGGYYLCRDCNNNTGSWYIEEYVKFANTLSSMIQTEKIKIGEYVSFTLFDLYPLRIFKAIITLICDTNRMCCLGDNRIQEFLLDKENNDFDTDKYQVYACLVAPGSMRVTGKTAELITYLSEPVILSEVSHYPLGFALYINKPKGFEPPGVNITSFVKQQYNEKCKIIIHGMPYYEINTNYPMDFRTKDEIRKCVSEAEIQLQNEDKNDD
jgi:hypothetical protein